MTLSRASRDAGTFPALVLTLLLLAPVSRAADVAFYLVAKGLAYDQTSTAQPVPKGSPDRFTALVGVTASNSITTASVQALPGGSVIPLVFQASGSAGILDEFNLTAKYTTNTDLNAAFPNGNYKMAIQTAHDGAKSLTLALNGNSYPASVPYLGNFTAAQKINPAAGFTLTWPAFSG